MKRILSIVLTLALLLTALPLALSVSAAETTTTYTFSSYTAGTQYAQNESHVLDDNLTLIINGSHLNSQIRLYAGSNAVFESNRVITAVSVNAGYKVDTLNVYGSTDGSEFTLIQAVSISSTSYKDYSVTIPENANYTQIKIESTNAQIRVAKATLTFGDLAAGACEHNYEETGRVGATCTSRGSITKVCSLCEDEIVEVLDDLGHDYLNGECQNCHTTDIIFEFGKLGAASHTDGSELEENTAYEIDNYTLTLTGLSKVYGNARDAKGNSCLKLGTGSVAATLNFTVPSNISGVIINVANYKAKTATITINDTDYDITTSSDNGEYMSITIDTTSTKAIALNTNSGSDPRIMINSITFVVGETTACTHENQTTDITNATYLKDGLKVVTCDDCGEELSRDVLPAATAEPVVYTPSYDAATNKLTINWTYSDDFVLDIDANTTFKLFYKLGEYENTIDVPNTVSGSVIFEGFNAARLDDTLYFGLTATITDVDTAKFNAAAAGQVVASTLVDGDSNLGKLMAAINSATDEAAVVAGQVDNTDTLVSNTMKADLKAGTLDLRFVASQTLIEKLNTLGKEGRTVTLTVTIGETVTKDITIDTLKKVTMVKITGMSFEQFNSKVTVKLGFDYEGTEKDFTTDVVEFNCGEIIADTDTAVANAFEAFMK